VTLIIISPDVEFMKSAGFNNYLPAGGYFILMPLAETYIFNPDQIDTIAELEKIAIARGLPELRGNAVQDVYRIYADLKKTHFFRHVFGKFGNTEIRSWKVAFTSDVFDAYIWEGEIVFIIEVSHEAIVSFHDDGFAIMKIKEWLVESYKKAVSDMRLSPASNKIGLWDYAFNRMGSPLPDDLLVLPFFSEEFAPGVPAVILAIVKPM
jgi:hypothetical protein